MANKYSNNTVKKIVENDTNHEYSLLSIESHGEKNPKTGKTMKRKMSLKHNKCGHTYKIDIYEFIEGKRRCGKCKGETLRKHFAKDIRSIRQETEEMTDGEYSFVDIRYLNSSTKHLFQHNSCGHIFEKTWNKFRSGQRCDRCQKKGMESGASRYVRDILDHLEIDYTKEKRFRDCLNPLTGMVLPFDYHLTDINTLLEVDGEQHERGSFSLYETEELMKRDRVKNRYAEEKGIELIRIPAKKWSQLPEILHDIIARDLLPTLTLKTVKSIAKSDHPERINKDLEKVHDGEYRLHDPFYFGVDREHWFEHTTCGHRFRSTLYTVKKRKHPCPACRHPLRLKSEHDRVSIRLSEKSNGRYSLDPAHIGTDEKLRRLTRCHQCNTSWWVTPGNLTGGKAGCPKCLENQNQQDWLNKMDLLKSTLDNGREPSVAQKKWLRHNRKRHQEGKLQQNRLLLLEEAGLL